MTNYTVASLTQTEAEDLTKDLQEAFYSEDEDAYYTYDDIAPNAPTTTIDDDINDTLFVGEMNGTLPVYKKKKPMFPR